MPEVFPILMKFNLLDHFGWDQNWESMENMDYPTLLLITLCIDGRNRRINLMSKGQQMVSSQAQVHLFEHGH